MGKHYIGQRKKDEVFIKVESPESISKSLDHIQLHSPTGMEWGYLGSGPADLALSILVDYFDEGSPTKKELAGLEPSKPVILHQRFKRKFVGGFSKGSWTLTEEEIDAWYLGQIGAICLLCRRGMKESDGCIAIPIRLEHGRELDPIKYGQEQRADWGRDGNRCGDCGAKPGQYHHSGCDVEECPNCGGQLIGCECLQYEDEEPEEDS